MDQIRYLAYVPRVGAVGLIGPGPETGTSGRRCSEILNPGFIQLNYLAGGSRGIYPTAGSGGGKEMESTRPTHLSFDEHSTALLSSFFSLESLSLS